LEEKLLRGTTCHGTFRLRSMKLVTTSRPESQRASMAAAYSCVHGTSIDTAAWSAFGQKRNPEVGI
jgi:hypothetical protein